MPCFYIHFTMKKFTISLFTFMFALACTNREDNEYKKNAEKYIGEYKRILYDI